LVYAAPIMLALPLAGFLVLVVAGKRLGNRVAGIIGTSAVGGSFVVALITFIGLLGRHSGANREVTENLFTWISAGPLQVKASLLIDPLSVTMTLFITGISFLIHLYSIGYMHGDRDFAKFFLYLNAFVFSMLLLVLGGNLLFTFVGWEGVGACSYWLVAFWFERDSAASAGKKAFIYNRIGDVGFLIAMFLIFEKTGSLQYTVIFAHLGSFGPGAATAACLLLFLGAAGKSAQIPLFPWLADAMEGPTPVSALIHAATMVTSGVYLLARMNPLLALSSDSRTVIASIGVATALVAATIACAQSDIKKVLAYSTVSQLGFMFLAVGSGAYIAAIFLMVAHAFFKGDLFLGAGSVIHGMDDEQDLKKMGGLAAYMPLTAGTFLFGWLAIAGIFPFSGFWAKGDVLANAFEANKLLWAIGVITALLTAYYMTRLYVLAFTGDSRWRAVLQAGRDGGGHVTTVAGSSVADSTARGKAEKVAKKAQAGSASHRGGHPEGDQRVPHESPWVMTSPLVVLAALSVLGGLLDLPWWHSGISAPLSWLDPVLGVHQHLPYESVGLRWTLSIVDALVAVVGLGAAWYLWRATSDKPALEPEILQRGWYIDWAFDSFIAKPSTAFAQVASVFDRKVIDGAVVGAASVVRRAAGGMRKVQTGYVRQYALGIVVGAVLLLAFMLARAL
jgi:NADH-quinone oxidoreductase subunit L